MWVNMCTIRCVRKFFFRILIPAYVARNICHNELLVPTCKSPAMERMYGTIRTRKDRLLKIFRFGFNSQYHTTVDTIHTREREKLLLRLSIDTDRYVLSLYVDKCLFL